jgi:DNA-binding transcriptional ArsR family regulator
MRIEILRLLLEEQQAKSPKELAIAMGAKLPSVSYHMRALEERGAIDLVEEEPIRGSVAHFYVVSDLVKNTPWVMASLKKSEAS